MQLPVHKASLYSFRNPYPLWEGRPPTPLEIPIKLHAFLLICRFHGTQGWDWKFLGGGGGGEHGYFLALHIQT